MRNIQHLKAVKYVFTGINTYNMHATNVTLVTLIMINNDK